MARRAFPFLMLGLLLVCGTCALGATVRLLETGSSLVYPLMNLWVAAYQRDHHVEITTQSTGSGTGIAQAIQGIAQIGASDAYMPKAQTALTQMANIPLAVGAQEVAYNLPGWNDRHLRLSGPVLARIYDGTIRFWDDPAIARMNAADASRLPHQAIIPIHRADASGDTFMFTQYLTFSDAVWKHGPGYGTAVDWPPVPQGVGVNGNPGMIEACRAAPYTLAYIGGSFIAQTLAAGLGEAALRNRAGAYLLPTRSSVGAAAAASAVRTPPDGRISIVFTHGRDAYPIVNYEYAIVNPHQQDAATADALRGFLSWVIAPDGGNARRFLRVMHFLPLPPSVRAVSERQIRTIGTRVWPPST